MSGDNSTRIRSAGRAARALVALCTLAASACAAAPGGGAHALRLMSYNIAAGHGDLAQIGAVIRAAAPDVVALQEVDVHWSERSGFADQAAALGQMLDMQVRFAPIYEVPTADAAPQERRAPARQFGVAILSRHPIVEFRNHIIPRLSTQTDDSEPRPLPGFLEAVIAVRGDRIHVFNTHLDYRADPRVRVQQVAAMLELMPEAVPLILMGDLNAPPAAGELQPLLARLSDAWAGRQESGHTYPASTPDRRIDYILLSAHFTVSGARVVPAAASDHLPVVADVLVNARRRWSIEP
ncbi:MAG: endonuclease/exonuclease/phosphatase family protein [Longimicrobiales bacterium]